MFNAKLEALMHNWIKAGMLPRDAMDKAQSLTRKEYTRNELRDAANSCMARLNISIDDIILERKGK